MVWLQSFIWQRVLEGVSERVCEAVWSVGTGRMRDSSEPAVAHCVKTLSGLNILSLIVVGFCIL